MIRRARMSVVLIAVVATGAATLVAVLSTSEAAPLPSPVFGKLLDVIRVTGMVTTTAPGKASVRVTDSRQVPVGSRIDASHGVVRLVMADANKTTYSGEFSKGAFNVLQSATGNGSTDLHVVGLACNAAHTVSVPPARIATHHPRVRHFLDVHADSRFHIFGGTASATASGQAVFSLVEACDGTHIIDLTGAIRVKARTGSFTLHPKQSLINYCNPFTATRVFCQLLLSRPNTSVFSFGLLLVPGDAAQWQVCFTPPGKANSCHTGPLVPSATGDEAGDITCIVNDGPGIYPVRWFLSGRQRGRTFTFKATQPRDPALGSGLCSASVINVSP